MKSNNNYYYFTNWKQARYIGVGLINKQMKLTGATKCCLGFVLCHNISFSEQLPDWFYICSSLIGLWKPVNDSVNFIDSWLAKKLWWLARTCRCYVISLVFFFSTVMWKLIKPTLQQLEPRWHFPPCYKQMPKLWKSSDAFYYRKKRNESSLPAIYIAGLRLGEGCWVDLKGKQAL